MFLLSQVAIKKGRPQITIKDLGTFYLTYDHQFPTKKLSETKYTQILQQTKDLGLLPHEKGRGIIQVYHPINKADLLPSTFQRRHYLEQLRWRIGNPNTLIKPSPQLIELLQKKQQIDKTFEEIVQENYQQYQEKNQAQITRKLNLRIKSLEEHLQQKTLPPDPLDRQLIQGFLDLPAPYGIKTEFNRGLELEVKPNHLSLARPLRPQQLREQKWLLLDIEKPLYGEADEEVSWITIACPQLKLKEVHTLRKTSFPAYKDYQLIHHPSEEALLENLIHHINTNIRPEIISAHNAPYDLISIREALEKNKVDKEDFYPKKEVSKKFFERIRIDQLQVVDLLRYAQRAFKFLPDHKLETVAKHVLGEDGFVKGLNYDQLRALERSAKETEDKPAADQLAVYAVEDVLVMEKLLEKIYLPEAFAPLCTYFNLELCRALHNPASVNNLRRRGYFENVGTYLEDFEHFSKKLRQRKEKLQQQVKTHKLELVTNHLDYQQKPGFHPQVTLAYFPWGDYLRQVLINSFPRLSLFFQEKYSRLDNQEVQYIQSQYLDSFLESAWMDYLDYQNNPQQKTEKKRIFIGRHKTLPSEFAQLLEEKVEMLTNFFQSNKLDLLYTDGTYFFFHGQLPERKPPFLLLAQSDMFLPFNSKPIYRLAGKYTNIKTKRKPHHFHTIFEMRLYRKFLDAVFSHQPQQALNISQQLEEQLLQKQVPPHDLLYWNRSKDIYSGFEQGEKTLFYLDQTPPPEADLEAGLPFLTLTSHNKEKKVYFYRDDDFQPDYAHYHQKIFGPQSKFSAIKTALEQQLS